MADTKNERWQGLGYKPPDLIPVANFRMEAQKLTKSHAKWLAAGAFSTTKVN